MQYLIYMEFLSYPFLLSLTRSWQKLFHGKLHAGSGGTRGESRKACVRELHKEDRHVDGKLCTTMEGIYKHWSLQFQTL
jgi:hypothetical protein